MAEISQAALRDPLPSTPPISEYAIIFSLIILTEWSDKLKWLWNLTEWQVTESVLNWGLRELKELLLRDNAAFKTIVSK